MVISTNAKKLKHSKSKTKQSLERESPSHDASQPNRPSCPNSSRKRVSQRKITIVGESNEGCLGGGDGEDPP